MKSNFNFYDKSKVYTSAIDLYGIDNFVPYTQLPESFVSWIENTSIELINKSTMAEIKFKSIMSKSNTTIAEQVFFNINGKSYFVDFFLPEYLTIIEIDGSSHIKKQCVDIIRDNIFANVGIKTIRLTNQDIYRDDFKKHISALLLNEKALELHQNRYYDTPISNRYNNELTKNQMFYELCINKIKKEGERTNIIIETDSTYFIKSFYNSLRYKPEQKNFGLLMRFLKVIYENKVAICMKYVGSRDKLPRADLRLFEEFDSFVLTFNHAKKYDLRYSCLPAKMKQTTKILEQNLEARLNHKIIKNKFIEYKKMICAINKNKK